MLEEIENNAKNYEKNLKKIEKEYLKEIGKDKSKLEKLLRDESEATKKQFEKLSKATQKFLDETSENIMLKTRNTKEINLIHRITLMEFFSDYCDAKMYYTFEPCSRLETPSLNDNFNTILEKINLLEWDALTQIPSIIG